MNAAYISADDAAPVFGNVAASVHVQETLRALLKRGISTDLFAANFGGPLTTEFGAVRARLLPPLPKDDPAARELAAVKVNSALRDLLQAHHRERPFSLVYERHSLWSCAAMEFAREEKIPGVLEVNAPALEEAVGTHRIFNRAEAEDVTMRAFRAATVITTVSRELAHIIGEHPSARNKIHIVPNAINPVRFEHAVPALQRAHRAFVIGFVGALRPWQGLTSLLHAFQVLVDPLPQAQLVIVGEGPEREPLEREIAARSLGSKVALLGALPPHHIPGVLASLDVAVAPYPALARFYLSPLKVFEYMAAGLPVVASRVGQVGDLIEHGVSGLLVPPGNTMALAETLFELAQSPERRRKLGAAAREKVFAEFTWDRSLQRVLRLAGLA